MKGHLLIILTAILLYQCSNIKDKTEKQSKIKIISSSEKTFSTTSKNDSLTKILLTTVHMDSLPFKHYWKVIEDSFNVSNDQYHRLKLMDKSFRIIKGHFISRNRNEFVLQRTFQQVGGSNWFGLQIACIYSFYNNIWHFERLLSGDSVAFIDVDNDSIYENIIMKRVIGNGDLYFNFAIMSLKNNIPDTLFQSYGYDYSNGICGYTMKDGDTLSDLFHYKFKTFQKNKPSVLEENRKIGIKKGWSYKKEEPLIQYISSRKLFQFQNNHYSNSFMNKDHIPDGIF